MKIWMYWENSHGKTKPPYLELCLETIKSQSKGLELVLLNDHSVVEYLPNLRDLSRLRHIAQKVDYIRVNLVYRYGGVWMDSDLVAMKPIATLVEPLLNGFDFVTCNPEPSRPGNWCFAAHESNELLRKWLDKMDFLLDSGKSLDWNDLGSRIIVSLLKQNSARVFDFGPELVCPISWDRVHEYLDTKTELKQYSTNNVILFSLFNKVLPEQIKKMSKKELLSSNMLISKIFRSSLGSTHAKKVINNLQYNQEATQQSGHDPDPETIY